MNMKLFQIKNIDKFFEIIDSCNQKVELVSKYGDRINLKSKLAQYLALAKIFSNNEIINELELVTHDPEDAQRLVRFMYDGNE